MIAALCALLVASLPPWQIRVLAAVAADTANSAINNCTATTGPSFSITPSGSDRLLVIGGTHFDTNNDAAVTITVGGSSTGVTLRQDNEMGGNTRNVYLYYLLAPAASALTVAATFSNNVDGDCALGAIAFSGVDQGTPFGTTANQTEQNTTTCTVSPSGGDAGGAVVQMVFGNGGTLSWNQTQQWEQESILGGNASAGMQTVAGASATMTATLGSSGLNSCIGEVIMEASAGGATPCLMGLLGVGCDVWPF